METTSSTCEHDTWCYLTTEKSGICICAALRRARADERERIAQAIEARGTDMPKGARTHDYYVGLHDASKIARNGGNNGTM